MSDGNDSGEPQRLRIETTDLQRAAPGAPRVVVDPRALPPAPPAESPATRGRDRRTLWIAAALFAVLVLVVGVFGAGILIARTMVKPDEAKGGVSVRVPSDGEKRAIDKGDLALVAPSVEGRSGGILGAEWGGSAIPWRLTADGRLLLVTNAHVAEGPGGEVGALEVVFASGARRKVTAVGIADHKGCDLAILALDAKGLTEGTDFRRLSPQPLDEWSSLAAGDEVVAVGTPLGYPQTQTFGRISALRDAMPEFGSLGVRWVQVDATVLPGNSGGPLLRLVKGDGGKDEWRWVGVITAKGVTGIGFAIHAGEVTAKSFRWVLGGAPSFFEESAKPLEPASQPASQAGSAPAAAEEGSVRDDA